MNYNLNKNIEVKAKRTDLKAAFLKLLPLMPGERGKIIIAAMAIALNSAMNLLAPVIVGQAVDKYILTGQYRGVLLSSALLLAMYLAAFGASYIQTRVMGGVGQRVLFNLRNAIFSKLQELPVAFFNQNKAGDLISRINNDTDKLNQFFSQTLMQFIGNIFIMLGAGIALLIINPLLGAASLLPALAIVIFTWLVSPWVKKKNAINMKSVGGMSAEIQQSLDNFKVIVAFNRSDYFREQFDQANKENYQTAIGAGLANNLFTPIYGLAALIGQLIVLVYGIHLILTGNFTLGLLISFLSYINRFYEPLRHLAALWNSFQVALAGWDRVSEILSLDTNLKILPEEKKNDSASLLEFNKVHFGYPDGKEVLHEISFSLEQGKTYALVGPTGGGKTTTASLMARLYDPAQGKVFFKGQDIRSYQPEVRTKKIGFILQDPFLFSGSVRDNILYGNDFVYHDYSNSQLEEVIEQAGLKVLLKRFDQGLETKISAGGEGMSLGQKQLIAFMRAVLRNPELLILDEATANIDTVTEQLLEEILKKLPKTTTKVIIAHRLNTIENADEIFFVNAGKVIKAGSMEHAVDMLLHGKRNS